MGNVFTLIAKALVFTTLVFGIGVATLSTTVYSLRPPWYDPVPDGGIDKGSRPMPFALMTAQINESSKSATAASNAWGAELNALVEAEKDRDARREKMFGSAPNSLLVMAQKGAPGGGPAFYNLKTDETTGLLDLDPSKGTPVNGQDGQPLKGADTLLATYSAHADEIDQRIRESAKLRRDDLKRLSEEVFVTETRLAKQRDIREQLRNEAEYLASLEVNVTEQKATATRRRDQLQRRLDVFKKGRD